MDTKLTLNNSGDPKSKIKYGGRRMKIYIKLNKSETEAWRQIRQGFQGMPHPEEEIVKMMFFRGVNAFMEDLKNKVDSMSDEEKEAMLSQTQEGSESKTAESNIEADAGSKED